MAPGLATSGPILVRLDCDDAVDEREEHGGGSRCYSPMSHLGGHAVALVGYDQDLFIVRNTWGTTLWGDKGFAYASNAYAAAAFSEAYGVNLV